MACIISSCKDKTSEKPTEPVEASTDSTTTTTATDSTLYVHTLESGMSTFLCVTEAGDTLELERGENCIYGNLDHAGDRFALTIDRTDKDYPAVKRAINLSNLDALTKDYQICNAQLILQGDTVKIIDLTPHKLIAKGRKDYTLSH